jgi:hydrogenase maturation protein HypF
MPARSIRVRGVVQGVGFRPFVYRLARANTLTGWVRNASDGVEIHLEGAADRLSAFVDALQSDAPPAASIATIDVHEVMATGVHEFTIRDSAARDGPTVRMSPDLALCEPCRVELFDPRDRRFGYPYINCTDCGPRYSIIRALPYDRAATTMAPWAMDEACAREYHDPASRRFHAQPVACPDCGPHYVLDCGTEVVRGDQAVVGQAAVLLGEGRIVAIKGLGGYHLACDARNGAAVRALRERKFRKEKPFALMVRDHGVARRLTRVSDAAEALLTSAARPIVLLSAREAWPDVAPDNDELGLMLPYTPLHELLFAAGAPDALVMTSANRSSEPIAYEDDDALERLRGIADAFLIGERPIARRVEDSVVRRVADRTMILRRSRGYAPGAVCTIPVARPVLALGADLKNAITLVVNGQAFVSQHVGDLDDARAARAFDETVRDLLAMYDVNATDLVLAHDAHPEYVSSARARGVACDRVRPVQHHRAHVASVLAERGAWDARVAAVSVDGTGYGDDGTIWGCELFAGSIATGFARAGHLRPAALVGGDAAARHPVQAAAGFLHQLDDLPPLAGAPFFFPARYRDATRVLESDVRTFTTTSAGRLFDAVAALVGFTRPITFEGQAAQWLEHLARRSPQVAPYAFPFENGELDFRPLLASVLRDRQRGRAASEIARAFHVAFAVGIHRALRTVCEAHRLDTVVASGGVCQNALLLDELERLCAGDGLALWLNAAVPPNDGGVSLGQAALAALGPA